MQKDFDGLVTLMGNNVGIFEQVPGGLAHDKPLVQTMQANVDNYHKADQLPRMGLFTCLFVVPGILLVGLGALGLFAGRKPKAADDHTMTPATPGESPHANKQLVSSSQRHPPEADRRERSMTAQAAEPRSARRGGRGRRLPIASAGATIAHRNVAQDLFDVSATPGPCRSVAHLARHSSAHTP